MRPLFEICRKYSPLLWKRVYRSEMACLFNSMEALYLRLMKLNLPTSLKPGPGVVITGAFIGPGTVTLCLMAGVTSRVSLLWALLFSTFATILLQDMVVRLALQSQQTLETLILRQIKNPVIQWMMALFIFLP